MGPPQTFEQRSADKTEEKQRKFQKGKIDVHGKAIEMHEFEQRLKSLEEWQRNNEKSQ